MIILLTTIHVIVCLFLIIVVLLQSGKAADLAGAFGGMGSQTAFGPRGAATVLSKATTISAVLFMVCSLGLAILHTRQGSGGAASSVLEKNPPPVTQQQAAPKSVPIQVEDSSGRKRTVDIPVKQEPTPGAQKSGEPAKK